MIDDDDLQDLVKDCPVADELLKQHGCHDVLTAFNIANHLYTHNFFEAAAKFYQVAIDYRKQDPQGYPREEIFLQVKLLCFIKEDIELDEEDLIRLRELSEPLFNYVMSVQLYKYDDLPVLDALNKIGCAYELFHSGEEIDTVYLSLIYEGLMQSNFPNKVRKTEIPRKMFFYWDQNMPRDIVENIEYHQRNFQKYFVDVFNKDRAAEWLYKYYGREAQSIFLKARHPAEAADILSVHLINLYGGFWVDVDLKIFSEEIMEKYMSRNYDNVLFLTDDYFIHNDFFAATANNIILKDCLLSLYRNCYEYGGLFISYKTGPGIFMRAVNRNYFTCLEGVSKEFPSLKLMNQEMFDKVAEQYPVDYKKNKIGSAV